MNQIETIVPRHSPSRRLRLIFLGLTAIVVLGTITVAAVGGVFIYEWSLRREDPAAADFWWQYPSKPLIISSRPVIFADSNVHWYAIYPNVIQDGVAPWEAKGRAPEETIYRQQSNEYGFFTRHPINQYPAKQQNQFRVVIVGGSGAQGHGATSWDRLFYVILERQLNDYFRASEVQIEVINLAMAGGYAATNAIVLNRFAHALDPNLLLFYNGANDIAQFTQQIFWQSACNQAYTTSVGATYDYPPELQPLADRFPYLMNKYGWGTWLKARYYNDYYWKKAYQQCYPDNQLATAADGSFDSRLTFDSVAYPSFVRSLKSVKRDFCGIPIVWARQAIHSGENALYEQWIRPGIYGEFYERATADLRGYYNQDWDFIDVEQLARRPERIVVPNYRDTSLAVHLDDAGHEIVGKLLADELTPLIRELASRAERPHAACNS